MRREKGQPRGIPHRRRWAGPPSGLLRSAPQRLRATQPCENLAPRKESTYNNNQPIGNLSELTKKTVPFGSVFRATSEDLYDVSHWYFDALP
jgi:hypothetical protein